MENLCSDYKEPNRVYLFNLFERLNYVNFLGVSEEFNVVNHCY